MMALVRVINFMMTRTVKPLLRSVTISSPFTFADSFQAPVLLPHGEDDIVTPVKCSGVMEKASGWPAMRCSLSI